MTRPVCGAVTFADGSWHCALCLIGGDKDEPIDEFCKLPDDTPADPES